MTKTVDLWLDDERPAPSNWLHVKTYDEAVLAMQSYVVSEMSLDHDLGMDEQGREKNGYHFVLWMAEHGIWPLTKPQVHSQNPVGRAAMHLTIDRFWSPKTEPPSAAPTRKMSDDELESLRSR